MNTKKILSRRFVLASLAASPVLASAALADESSFADSHLLALGHQFDALAAHVDCAINQGSDIGWDALEQFSHITTEILTIQAKTIDGLRVKARAACWALLGNLDPTDDMTLDKSMALSIVRDLIRIHDPSLEHPGALRKLVEDATNGATKSIAHQRDDIV